VQLRLSLPARHEAPRTRRNRGRTLDGELLERLEANLRTLDEGELRMIRQLIWNGCSEDELAPQLGVTRQAVNKRKHELLRRLGSDLMLEGVA
jgi:DNA-directed RNA polymerase specialized sigma24 family protein